MRKVRAHIRNAEPVVINSLNSKTLQQLHDGNACAREQRVVIAGDTEVYAQA